MQHYYSDIQDDTWNQLLHVTEKLNTNFYYALCARMLNWASRLANTNFWSMVDVQMDFLKFKLDFFFQIFNISMNFW